MNERDRRPDEKKKKHRKRLTFANPSGVFFFKSVWLPRQSLFAQLKYTTVDRKITLFQARANKWPAFATFYNYESRFFTRINCLWTSAINFVILYFTASSPTEGTLCSNAIYTKTRKSNSPVRFSYTSFRFYSFSFLSFFLNEICFLKFSSAMISCNKRISKSGHMLNTTNTDFSQWSRQSFKNFSTFFAFWEGCQIDEAFVSDFFVLTIQEFIYKWFPNCENIETGMSRFPLAIAETS